MSSPTSATTGARRNDARTKAARLQAQAAAAERRRRSILVAVAVAVVTALAVGVTLVVRHHNATSGQVDAKFGKQGVIAVPAPAGSRPAAKNAVTIRTAFDYICPYCKQLEEQTDAWQQEQVKAGRIKREIIPVAVLNDSSNGTRYSTRSAAAAYAVATADPSKVLDFTAAMYADQPEEGSDGLSNARILQTARRFVAHNSAMDNDITARRYESYVTRVSDQASKDGLAATPTVWVNGTKVAFDHSSPMLDQLKKAVDEAATRS